MRLRRTGRMPHMARITPAWFAIAVSGYCSAAACRNVDTDEEAERVQVRGCCVAQMLQAIL